MVLPCISQPKSQSHFRGGAGSLVREGEEVMKAQVDGRLSSSLCDHSSIMQSFLAAAAAAASQERQAACMFLSQAASTWRV